MRSSETVTGLRPIAGQEWRYLDPQIAGSRLHGGSKNDGSQENGSGSGQEAASTSEKNRPDPDKQPFVYVQSPVELGQYGYQNPNGEAPIPSPDPYGRNLNHLPEPQTPQIPPRVTPENPYSRNL